MWAHIRAAHSIKRLYDSDKPKFENIPFAIKRSHRSMNIDELVEARVNQILAARDNNVSRNIQALPGTNDVRVTVSRGVNTHGGEPMELVTRVTRTVREETTVEEVLTGMYLL